MAVPDRGDSPPGGADEPLDSTESPETGTPPLNALIDEAQDAIFLKDASGRYTYVNDAMAKAFGRRRDEIVGRTAVDLLGPELGQEALQLFQRAMAGEVVEHIDTIPLADGPRRVHALLTPRRPPGGKKGGVSYIARDVTSQTVQSEEVERVKRIESVGSLAGGIAHRFNNLLVGVLGNVSLVRSELPTDSRAHRLLREAEASAKRARELTQELLTFAEGGEPVPRKVDLCEVLEQVFAQATLGTDSHGSLQIDPQTCPVAGDRGQLAHMLTNVLENAVEASPRGSSLDVRCAAVTVPESPRSTPSGLAPGRYARVQVSDQGEGIPEDDLPRVYEPFFSTKAGHTGLGLALAHSVARRHGGRLRMES